VEDYNKNQSGEVAIRSSFLGVSANELAVANWMTNGRIEDEERGTNQRVTDDQRRVDDRRNPAIGAQR
jgi:hypothetical protein